MGERLNAAAANLNLRRRLDHATDLAAKAWHLVDHLSKRTADHEGRIQHLERLAAIDATMSWIGQAHVAEGPLVSVVMVTRNRSQLVPEALASIDAQHYSNWELILIDDASDPDHARALVALAATDDRIVRVGARGRGVAAGRNRGREEVSGAFVTYLDDDNLMHPLWLKAIVWGFGQRPSIDVFCGARLLDDVDHARGRPPGGVPAIQFEKVDADVLERRMQSDIGSIAHRSSVDTLADERFARCDDWDWLARTTREYPYASLPCVAQTYRTTASGRMSEGAVALGDSG